MILKPADIEKLKADVNYRFAKAVPIRPGVTFETLVETTTELYTVLSAIRQALDVPRNRMGRLMSEAGSNVPMMDLAVKYKIGGATDTPDQIVKVIDAISKGYSSDQVVKPADAIQGY